MWTERNPAAIIRAHLFHPAIAAAESAVVEAEALDAWPVATVAKNLVSMLQAAALPLPPPDLASGPTAQPQPLPDATSDPFPTAPGQLPYLIERLGLASEAELRSAWDDHISSGRLFLE